MGSEKLFIEKGEYDIFLFRWYKYISPIAFCYVYCLMPNHFHFLIRMKSYEEISEVLELSEYQYNSTVVQRFSNFYNSYAKSFNFRHHRMGKLFMLPFKRKIVASDEYFRQLVYYIHRNPLHHGILMDPAQWDYSSYAELVHEFPTRLHRIAVLNWFGGKEKFIKYHQYMNLLPE